MAQETEDKGVLATAARWLGIGKKTQSHKFSDSEVESALLEKNRHIISTAQVSVDYKSVLGHGSFGSVYRGKYKDKPCAVKIFNTGVDIEKEAKVCSLIQHHENIVQVYGFWYGEKKDGSSFPDGQPALVMELCSTNLKSYLDGQKKPNNRFTIANKLTILHQITSAMIYLHNQHIVHGDLSAANVFLQNEGPPPVPRVRVGDFGQARVLNAESLKHLTKTPENIDIMPPEVLQGEVAELTMQVDVFSFGCLVPYVATCVYPKPAPMGSEFEKRKQCLNGVVEAQLRIFEPLMKKCLDDKPHWRGTFEDVLQLLLPNLKKYHGKGKYLESEEEKTREIEKLKGDLLGCKRKIQDIKEEMEEYRVSCEKQQTENESLQTANSILQKDLQSSSASITQLEDTLKERNSTIRELNDKLFLSESKWDKVHGVEKVMDKYDTLKDDHTRLKDEKEDLIKKCREIEEQLTQTQYTCDKVKSKCSDLEQNQKDSQWEINSLKEGKKNNEVALEQMRSSLSTLRKEKETLTMKCSHLKDELEACQQEKNRAEGELATSNMERQELTTSLKSTTVAMQSSGNERTKLQHQIDSLRGDMKKAKAASCDLDRKLSASQKSESSLKETLSRCQRDLKASQSKTSSQESDLRKLKEELKDERRKIRDLDQCVQTCNRKLEAEKKKVKEFQKEVDESKTQLRSKEQGAYSLSQQLAKEKTRANAAERTCGQLQGEVKELTDRNTALTQSERSLKARLESTKKNNDELQQEKTILEKKKNELDRNVKQLNHELGIAKDVSAKTAREWSDLKARYDKAQEENVLLQESETEIKDLKEKLTEREEGHSQTITELKKEKEKGVVLQSEVQGLKEDIIKKDETLRVREARIEWFESKVGHLNAHILKGCGQSVDQVEKTTDSEEPFQRMQEAVSQFVRNRDEARNSRALADKQFIALQKRYDSSLEEFKVKEHEQQESLANREESLQRFECILNELKDQLANRDLALQQLEDYQNRMEELLQTQEHSTKSMLGRLRVDFYDVHSKLSCCREATVQMNNDHLKKVDKFSTEVGMMLSSSQNMGIELKVVRQDVEEVRTMLQLSHESRLRVIAKLQRTTAQLKDTSVQLEDSQLNFLMNSEEERERQNQEVAQYQDECGKLKARLRVVEASREEEMRKLQDAEDKYERLKHKHAKCRDLRRREQEVSMREEDVRKEQAEVQSERTRLQTETEAIQEMKSKFKYYFGTMGLPQSQMDHMLSKIGQELSTFLREYVPGSSDSSSDQLDGVADESLEGSYEKRELHLMLVEKNKFIAELKKENQDLKSTVDQLKAALQDLNHSTQRDLQASKAAREMLVREKRQLQGQLDLWRQNYFLVQRYPFFVHAFHLRGLHSLTSNGQQYVSSKVFCSDVEALTPDTVKEVLGTTRVVLSDLFGAVLEAVGRHLDLSLSATFHYCAKGKAKIYRFCIISASNVLVQDARIHPNPEEGGAISRALFAYSSVEVKEEVFKLFPFKPSIKGVYYLTDIEGRVKEFRHFFRPDMWTEEEPIKSITGDLDGVLARHLDSLYSAFAKPKPIMSVPDTPANEPRSRPST